MSGSGEAVSTSEESYIRDGELSIWLSDHQLENLYVSVFPDLAPGRYQITFRDVPADAFYSVSVYNGDGYFEPGPSGVTNIDNVFGAKNPDGSMTVRLGDFDDDQPNTIPTPEGWNLLTRLYRPRAHELKGWTAPTVEPAS